MSAIFTKWLLVILIPLGPTQIGPFESKEACRYAKATISDMMYRSLYDAGKIPQPPLATCVSTSDKGEKP